MSVLFFTIGSHSSIFMAPMKAVSMSHVNIFVDICVCVCVMITELCRDFLNLRVFSGPAPNYLCVFLTKVHKQPQPYYSYLHWEGIGPGAKILPLQVFFG